MSDVQLKQRAPRCGWCGEADHAEGVHCPHCNSIGCELPCDCGAALPEGRVVVPSPEVWK